MKFYSIYHALLKIPNSKLKLIFVLEKTNEERVNHIAAFPKDWRASTLEIIFLNSLLIWPLNKDHLSTTATILWSQGESLLTGLKMQFFVVKLCGISPIEEIYLRQLRWHPIGENRTTFLKKTERNNLE